MLAAAGAEERITLLRDHPALVDAELARALKALYLDMVSSNPVYASGAAAALASLACAGNDPEIAALATWTAGLAALQIDAQMERAITLIDEAEAAFLAIGQPLTAAATQVSKVAALAILGRYDEAIVCGLRARDIFLRHGDLAAAGRIEHNLGNIHGRRGHYHDAEQIISTARARFLVLGDEKQLALVENSLAQFLVNQHKFRDAARLYEEALARAQAAGIETTLATVENNLGELALFQGHYGQALDLLERARRRYAALGMAHHSAVAEQELASAYLELNLAPEAEAIYERVTPTFASLGMRAEQAAAQAQHGRACLLLGRTGEARALLEEARALYAAEGNAVGEAEVTLTEVQLSYAEANYAAAGEAAARAEAVLTAEGVWRRALLARWLRGEAARALGKRRVARTLLASTLREAERQAVPQVMEQCHLSLGLLAAAAGNAAGAEASFKRAIALTESLRAPLPAEEFRTAFLAGRLTPYTELVRLCLADGTPERMVDALGYVERARSRALVEMLGGALQPQARARDEFEADLFARLEELREDLNWFYSRINRPGEDEAARGPAAMKALHAAVRGREDAILEIMRQLQQRGGGAVVQVEPVDIARVQSDLGPDTALLEYFTLDGDLLAFLVTRDGIEVVRDLGSEAEVEAALAQLRFQLESLRYGAERLRPHLNQLSARARHHLARLYDLLLRPVEGRLGDRRLVVVPHRALHYVPFHALHDGTGYVVERREVVYAPSAGVLSYCLAAPHRPLHRALLLGVPDEQTPRVRDEVRTLAPLFPEAVTLLDAEATPAALYLHAPHADVVHLACHGQFRPDNPLFSSLRLAGGWLTVRDAYSLDLHCELVTLSACETGVSAVAPGDELIGLARGFFSAGAPALLVSLWTVDDDSTAALMTDFYSRLREGDGPAAALRYAQCRLLERDAHPFFWSPFVLVGRW